MDITSPPIAQESDKMTTTTMEAPDEAEDKKYQTRSLVVQHNSWMSRNSTVLDVNTKTSLYRIEHRMWRPQITMRSVLENDSAAEPIGDATFYILTSRTDIHLHGHSIELTDRGWLKDGFTYTSPTRNGEKMTWQREKGVSDLSRVCLDEKGLPVARAAFTPGGITKYGTVELLGKNVTNEGKERDEIVLTALAMIRKRMVEYNSASMDYAFSPVDYHCAS